MLHGQSPWECFEEQELINKIKTEKIVYKNGVSEKMKQIISSCLEIDREKRESIEKVANQLE